MSEVTEYFNTVYDATFRELLRLCLLKVRAQDAHDVLQNTYAKFYRHIQRKGKDAVGDPESYLKKILKHETARYYRAHAKLREVPLETAENEADGSSPEELGLGKAAVGEIVSCLKAEPELTRRIFILYYGYGMKLGDIAKEIGATEESVKSRLKRVRKKLRAELGEENYNE